MTGLLETCITRRLEIQHVFATQTSAMALVGRKLVEGIIILTFIDVNVKVRCIN